MNLGQGDQGRRGGDHVARVDIADAGHAIDRRDDARVVQVDLGRAHGGLVRRHCRRQVGHVVAEGIHVELGDVALGDQRVVALERALRRGEQGFVLLLLGRGLVIGGLEGAGVDLRQQLALLHFLAFLEVDGQQLAAHLRVHRHGVERLHGAKRGEIDRHILLDHVLDGNRYRCGILILALILALSLVLPIALPLRTVLGRGLMQQAEAHGSHHDHSHSDQRDLPKTRHEKLPELTAGHPTPPAQWRCSGLFDLSNRPEHPYTPDLFVG